ncbi:MAG: hypothetical protein CMG60_03490 [Candidatus Marinimicrobia bacterium]|mgnify:CR=1 FL=1|nr:hypothetical protein [Candidatus Neomarinimicrobiota bacterium]|tara:strand:+ start:8446 stop:8628 length:183 start_codon:yes stop_codon:yes gene_type:complete
MIKWLFLFAIVYLLYKSAKPFLTVFRFSNTIKQKKRKQDLRNKIYKMDIQDAEYEENIDK